VPEATPLPVPAAPGLGGPDLRALEAAVAALERMSFARRLSALVGRRMGFAGRAIPPGLRETAHAAAAKALSAALRVALTSLHDRPARGDSAARHRRLAMASGAIGGAVGIASLPVELPISTAIMLRAIADIAREEGEDLRHPATAIACLEVFALGGHAEDGNLLEGGYLALRGMFAKSVSDATRYVASRGVADETAPALVRLIGLVAGRFGFVVSQKTAAQAVPLLGAISGAAVNLAFTEHFQTLARGHFTVRRLERAHGPALVRAEYERIARAEGFWREDAKTA
jgi:hypothetical protein